MELAQVLGGSRVLEMCSPAISLPNDRSLNQGSCGQPCSRSCWNIEVAETSQVKSAYHLNVFVVFFLP
ncbi:hypothetical protein RvY_15332 [Ramazzottius varieornatus]|uniref:Uncharacterized protein n=1 Tax=Ramazzottius varieornatus TaxID=947166 RepID=A0A1D1VUJ6_RAMVA|nr:hypothetical protein RvY_15332 [Ramazzottius varieornatus]